MSKKDEKKMKEAVWQYLIDHSSVADDKMYRIQFHVHSQSDFWARVRARKSGQYQRKDQKEFELRADKLRQRRETHSLALKKQKIALNKLSHGSTHDRARATVARKLLELADILIYGQHRPKGPTGHSQSNN